MGTVLGEFFVVQKWYENALIFYCDTHFFRCAPIGFGTGKKVWKKRMKRANSLSGYHVFSLIRSEPASVRQPFYPLIPQR